MSELPPERKVWYGVGEPPFDLTPFREQAIARDADIMWDYVLPFEDEQTGETRGGFWDAVLFREKRIPDGRILFYSVTLGHILQFFEITVEGCLGLLDQAWERLLEEHGVTAE